MKRTKLAALIISAVITAVIGISSVFIIINADHICDHSDCVVCFEIHSCNTVLRTFSIAAAAVSVATAIVFICDGETMPLYRRCLRSVTPVSLKIKLSD